MDKRHGVLTGADEAMEWLLPWWWSRYTDHNDLPVTFCDFGLSPEAKAWCQERGELMSIGTDRLRVREKEAVDPRLIPQWEAIYGADLWQARKAWFQKPLSLLSTPYRQTIWIDLDCEILSSLRPIFSLCRAPFGIVREFRSSHLPRFHPDSHYNGGVIVFEQGASLVEQWADAACEENDRFWGDDPLLSHLINMYQIDVAEIPEIWNWRMAQGINLNAAIVHWTGSGGKTFLRENGGLKPMLDTFYPELR